MNGWYSLLGLIVGSMFLTVGLICMMRRLDGNTTMQVVFWGVQFRIKTALPGIIFAILGLLVILVTRAD